MSVYILQLASGRYFIGTNKDEDNEWTRSFPIQSIINTIEESKDSIDIYVKDYMLKHGIENVRGGSYSNIILSIKQVDELEKIFDLKHSSREYINPFKAQECRCMECATKESAGIAAYHAKVKLERSLSGKIII
jgi:hypothetical protein